MGGIWIRSQDRRILKFVSEIGLYDVKGQTKFSDNPFDYEYKHTEIRAYDSGNVTAVLGIYSTKDRALEVLDEIQGRMYYAASLYTFSELTASDMKEVIFQMPTE